MARGRQLSRGRVLVRLFAAIPMFVAFDVPTLPEPVEYNQSEYIVWWYTNQRSQWTVIEDCWSAEDVHPAWWSLEQSLRALLSQTNSTQLVSSDLDWTSDGFCIRIQGLEPSVYEQRKMYYHQLGNGSVKRSEASIESLDEVHYAWLYSETHVPIQLVQNQIWKAFWKSAIQRTLVFAPSEQINHILNLQPFEFPVSNFVSLIRLPRKHSKLQSFATCNFQQSSHPQIAVTIEMEFEGLSSPELRILNMILGTGVRSRLSQSVREERGLVYSIGSRFTGTAIQVEYTVSPIHLQESIQAVHAVLQQLSETGVTEREWQSAKATFLLGQYEILEDPASMMYMFGRFSSPQGWGKYIDQTLRVFAESSLVKQPIAVPSYRYWLTGDFNSEIVTQSSGQKLCEALSEHSLFGQ